MHHLHSSAAMPLVNNKNFLYISSGWHKYMLRCGTTIWSLAQEEHAFSCMYVAISKMSPRTNQLCSSFYYWSFIIYDRKYDFIISAFLNILEILCCYCLYIQRILDMRYHVSVNNQKHQRLAKKAYITMKWN